MGAGWLLVGFGAAAWLFSIFASARFAAEKGRSPALGAALGCLFGVFGLMAVLMMPNAPEEDWSSNPWTAKKPERPRQTARRPAKPDPPARPEDPAEAEAFRLITGDGPVSPPDASPSRDTAPDPTSRRSRPSSPSRDLRA